MECHLYHIGSGSPVHGSILEEFPEGHGDTDEDEHSVSSVDGRIVKRTIQVLEDML